jgi:hypothetical protein
MTFSKPVTRTKVVSGFAHWGADMAYVRWILAVAGGIVSYWVAMLATLGIIGLILERIEHASEDRAAAETGHSIALLSLALGVGSFAAAMVIVAIAPHKQWRTAAALAVVAAAAWAVYGQFYAHHDITTALIEAGGGTAGAVVAYLVARGMFHRA